MITEYKFSSRDELIQQLLKDVMGSLTSSLSQKPQASMLLSGGSSPKALYEKMARQKFDWSNIWFGLTDERWVAPDHQDSNEKLVRDTLLQNEAACAHFIGLKSEEKNIVEGHLMVEENICELPFPYDLTLLGMGTDGHMASLFPDYEDIESVLDLGNKNLCQPIIREGQQPHRMTMTLTAILSSGEIKLLIFGNDKWQIYQEAKLTKSTLQPVSYLLHQTDTPVCVYWAE